MLTWLTLKGPTDMHTIPDPLTSDNQKADLSLNYQSPREKSLAEIGLIALKHGLTRHDILGRRRTAKVVNARRAVVLHFRAKGKTYPEIGAIIGRDSSSVQNLVKGRAKR